DDVELLWRAHQLHGAVVDVHVRELEVRIGLRLLRDDLAPPLRRFKHVRLAHRADALPALARRVERNPRDAPDLALAVAHGVEAFPLAGSLANALGLAEIDVAGQLAHDQDVEPGDDLRLHRRW